MIETTYSRARATLAKLCDEVAANRDTVLIRRRGAPDVVLIAADELTSLEETAHLLRSPRNARRLVDALERAEGGERDPQSLEYIRRDLGLVNQGEAAIAVGGTSADSVECALAEGGPLDAVVGVTEIAERANVAVSTVKQWRIRHADFPAPGVTLAMGPLWRWSDVAAWIAVERRPGRPRNRMP